MSELSKNTRLYREKLLADPYRPGYHFAIPDGYACPGDPNGAFYADGRYHLMYLYKSEVTNAFQWGHISSTDLLHWRNHPDALIKNEAPGSGEGYFSGGAFVDDDGTAYLSYWAFPSGHDAGGIGISYAKPPYEVWEPIDPIPIEGVRDPWGVKQIERNGKTEPIGCADPSNIWKKDGWYYLEAGNLIVLNQRGRAPDSEETYQGDWTELFRSGDLRRWEYVGRFYKNPRLGPDWPDKTEDDMCPSLLPLPDREADGKPSGKMLQLFISHNKGGQYYIGELKDETFLPEQHGRFTWKDTTCFAPEALMDPRCRQIGWFWLTDHPAESDSEKHWSGVYSFPRTFWLEDGILHMAPAEELARLQYNGQSFSVGIVSGKTELPVKNGASFRIRAVIDPKNAKKIGFVVRADEARGESTEIYADLCENTLVMDTTRSGRYGRRVKEAPPLALKEGEPLELDLFVDRSVIEVYANRRQAICRRVFPSVPSAATAVFAAADGADFGTVNCWEMMETNMY